MSPTYDGQFINPQDHFKRVKHFHLTPANYVGVKDGNLYKRVNISFDLYAPSCSDDFTSTEGEKVLEEIAEELKQQFRFASIENQQNAYEEQRRVHYVDISTCKQSEVQNFMESVKECFKAKREEHV